ncbi:hypothetical protein L596_005990 [Steinernema carpocapsae]|uniref:Eukaryotic translation initiation factor 3 subunit M n=1 Tax=Steinernema carpocapsae TaxID=34508 RepID=A0A4U8V0R7_STECR|nr:hypothetical protein L596_005990 [Steinernema carpocapsae]
MDKLIFSFAIMTDSKDMAVFCLTEEWEQVTQLRDYLNEKGANIAVDDNQSDENITKITADLVKNCEVLATCTPDEAEMALNSIVTLVASSPDNIEELVEEFCNHLKSAAFGGTGVQSMAVAAFHVLQNLFHNFGSVPSCQFVAFKALLAVASKARLMSLLDVSREAVAKYFAKWNLDVNQQREFLRLLHQCLLKDDRADAGAAVMVVLLGTYSNSDAGTAADDARECVKTALIDEKSFGFDHLLRLSAVKHLEKADPLMFRALKMFSEGVLSDYTAFVKENPKFVSDVLKVDEQVLLKKIRILTLMSMAENKKNQSIPLDTVSKQLDIADDETLEEFIIKAVQLNAVNAKINEKTRTLTINSFRHRTFGRPQWEDLQGRLTNLIANLKVTHKSMREITGDVVTEQTAVETS